MGREAACICTWGTQTGDVRALLETHEVIVRGSVRGRVARNEVRDVRVDGDALHFRAGTVPVTLVLGAREAGAWAQRLTAPPPSLAKKLGITEGLRVRIWGDVDGLAGDALGAARRVTRGAFDLALVRVETPAQLAALPDVAPVWVFYTKGRNAPVGENAVRATLRARGLIDIKTSAVNATHTALLFRRCA